MKKNQSLVRRMQIAASGATIHDINNILSAYSGCFDRLLDPEDDNTDEWIAIVERAEDRMVSFLANRDQKTLKALRQELRERLL